MKNGDSESISQQIAVLDSMKREVALIQSVPEAKDQRDKVEALRNYAKNAGLSLEMQNACAEMRLRYERRAGELLIEAGITRGNPQLTLRGCIGQKPTLQDFGLDDHKSAKWQKIARIPERVFEAFLDGMKAKVVEITTAAALKLYRDSAREDDKAITMKSALPPVTHFGQIIHGDMLQVLAQMDRGFADLILTDPPYGRGESADIGFDVRENMSKTAGQWDSPAVVSEFGEWARLLRRSLKPDGSLYCFVFDRYIGEMRKALEGQGFDVHGPLIWKKTNPPPSVRKRSYRSNYECLLYARAGEKFTFNWLGQDIMKKCLEFPICGGNERLDHPTQKPVNLLKVYIEVSSNEGDLVLDPFAGVGSTAMAAGELARRYLLIEKDEYYYKQACSRLREAMFF